MKIKNIIHSVINFFYLIKNFVKYYNKDELVQLETELKEKLNKLNQLASGEQFLRNKKVNELNNSIQNLLKLDRSFFWKILRSDESNIYLGKLKKFAENPNQFQSQANENFIKLETTKYKDLFDNIEKLPLTTSQRKACVINEENNLVLAGAGSGKTSVMVGRCAYLIESKIALSDEILVLAYNSDAASELTERINERIPNSNIKASTFHGLGSELIRMASGSRGQISDLVEKDNLKKFITENITLELENNISLRIEMFESLLPDQLDIKNEFQFETKIEYDEYIKLNKLRTMNKELVKSFGEIEIANYLFKNGINYKYEASYEIKTESKEYGQYYPDFYLPDHNIYIEYFGTDKEGNTAPYIDKNIYVQGIQWKRELHKTHKTNLIELFYSDLKDGQLLSKLDSQLKKYHVVQTPQSSENQFQVINDFFENYKISDKLISIFQIIEALNISFNEAQYRLYDSNPKKHEKSTLKLAELVYQRYLDKLKNDKTITFHTMITDGIAYLNNHTSNSKWKHILVDEFQDISDVRLSLLKALNKSCPATLFCVGDDWQSIYGFTGSNIEITINFSNLMENSYLTYLDQTFRFNNKISEVATKFITQNPIQVKKNIKTQEIVNNPRIELALLKSTFMTMEKVETFLREIVDKDKEQSIMVLSRNNKSHKDFKVDFHNNLIKQFPRLTFNYSTIHSSKGLESDFVIILGLTGGDNGYPSEKDYDSIITKIQKNNDIYPFAEERRLFYVALTRAKKNVLVISDYNNPSIFVRELLNGTYEIKTDSVRKVCPKCNTGYIIKKTNNNSGKEFLGCTNFYSESSCKYSE